MVGHGAFAVLAVAFCSACTWLLNEAEHIKQTLQHKSIGRLGYCRHARTCQLHCVTESAHLSDLRRMVSKHAMKCCALFYSINYVV